MSIYNKNKLLVVLLINIISTFFAGQVFAQPYGNEWVTFNKLHIKLPTWSPRIYRVSQATLISMGLPSTTTGAELKLIKDGAEVPLIVSTNGVFGVNDYIEFMGAKSNGIMDAEMYANSSELVNPNISFMYDTAFFFLTTNNASANLRYALQPNTISSPPAAEPYFWDIIDTSYKSSYVRGIDYDLGVDPFESSRFDPGEGYVKKLITNSSDSISYTLSGAYKGVGAPNIKLSGIVLGYSQFVNHNVRFIGNNIELDTITFPGYGHKSMEGELNVNNLTSTNVLRYRITNYNPVGDDNVGLCYSKIVYPRTPTLTGFGFKYFEVEPKNNVHYIEINGFNTGGVQPMLIDLTNNKMYMGDIGVSGKVRFQLPANPNYTKYYLINQAVTSRVALSKAEPITFTNHTLNQGNYLMLYSKYLKGLSTSTALQDYATYRSSNTGGNYKVAQIDVEELYNQFGYGYNYHAGAIRKFLKWAKANWTTDSIEYIVFTGKGLEFNRHTAHWTQVAGKNYTGLVPTFGLPGSDNVLTDLNFDAIQDYKIGRISCYSADELIDYLNKLKQYDTRSTSMVNAKIDSAYWKKKVLHIAGGNEAGLQATIMSAFNRQEPIIEDKVYGGTVKTVLKNSTSQITQLDNDEINKYINDGTGFIQYYGHSASTTFEFALKEAKEYTNGDGRYNTFIANGCDANNYFLDGPSKSLTENFLFSPNSGSVIFIGSSNNGYPGFLDKFTDSLYFILSNQATATKNIGYQLQKMNQLVMGVGSQGGMMRSHAEQIQLHGDPAASTHQFVKPDYAIEQKYITLLPSILNTSIDSFTIKCQAFNLAKSQKDSVVLRIKRTIGANTFMYTKLFANGINLQDSFVIKLPINKLTDKGLNTFSFKIDDDDKIDEVFETNNTVDFTINIYDDDIVPVYPPNYGILHHSADSKVMASTLDPFSVQSNYVFQIDTTALFNSSIFKTTKINSVGGVLTWNHGLTLWDSVVYYWRVAKDTNASNPVFNWHNSSFVYLTNGNDGWNQSHYYQYAENNFNSLELLTDRKFTFLTKQSELKIYNAKQQNPAPFNYSVFDFKVEFNGDLIYTSGCAFNVMHAVIIDSLTGKPLNNVEVSPGVGLYGSRYCVRNGNNNFFEFFYNNAANRKKIMDFIDSIPTGYYAAIYPHIGSNQVHKNAYLSDTAINGPGISLYHSLLNNGFTYIDSFNKNKPWVFFFRKGFGPSYIKQYIAKDSTESISPTLFISHPDNNGVMMSKTIGPATSWNTLLKLGTAIDNKLTDSASVEVIAIDSNNLETPMFTLFGADTSLSFIDAKQYPYLKINYINYDLVNHSAEQLNYWRILFTPMVDLALAPNLGFNFGTNFKEGMELPFSCKVINISNVDADSSFTKLLIQDKAQNKVQETNLPLKKLKALDTTSINYTFSSVGLQGNNRLDVNVNPNKVPVEVQYGNNIGYRFFGVEGDVTNPVLDVTFDGVRIFKDDIVSATPLINIKLKDDNEFLRLNDTSAFEVYLTYPGALDKERIYFSDSLKFIPAPANKDKENAAYIEFTPKLKDGIYDLEVVAKDKSGNKSGAFGYRNSFQVINEQTVSALLNYPNPFSTSTQFVFTLTGSQVPDQIKIQIVSITGKVVREITKQELGTLRIGKNITEYKWDGTDQMGDKLGNGVYFYRFVVRDDNKIVKHRNKPEIDKFIKNGMGKMVIIR
jgi:hypothetical protein